MDFHSSGKGFFFSASSEKDFWDPRVSHTYNTSIEKEKERLQLLYDSFTKPYTGIMECSCYPRERKAKLYFNGIFEEITITGKKIKWKDNGSTRFRFLKTPLFTARGRYLKTDMIMFLAKLSKARKTQSIASCCATFDINPSTCRSWANKLLLMNGFVPTVGRLVWEECEDLLSNIDSEQEAIQFLTTKRWNSGVFKNNDNPTIFNSSP